MMNLPDTMNHIGLREHGGADKMHIVHSPLPQPHAGQVLIRVMASGVNRADIMQRTGKYPPPPGVPDVLGLEVAGEIIALGEGVTAWHVGDIVCALVSGGGYAEYAVAEAGLCLPIPDDVHITDAAGLPEAVFTAYSNLVMTAHLHAGEIVLIHAGASGVGTMAIQLARALGAHVITTVGTHEKQTFCTDLGAELAINYTREDFASKVIAHTHGAGVNVILDMIGGVTTEKNLELLATNGRMVVIACPYGPSTHIRLTTLMQKRLQVMGTTLRSRPLAEKIAIAEAVREQVWPLFAVGKIKPVTYQQLKLSEAPVAHRILESRQHIGKIILTSG